MSKKDGFVRYLESFTNPGDTTVTKTVTFSSSTSAFGTFTAKTSDGNGSFTTADDWLVLDDASESNPAATLSADDFLTI